MESNMERTGSKESKPLAENLQEIGRSVKQMLKLIEDGESLSKKAEMHSPVSVAHIEEFYHLYQSLAERYARLSGDLQKNIPPDFQLQGSGNSNYGSSQGSPLLTPDQKLGAHKSGRQAASSSSGGSCDFSLKDGAELSSSSSSDSESESFNSANVYLVAPVNIDGKGLRGKIIELGMEFPSMKEEHQVDEKDTADGLLEVGENRSYQELLEKIVKYEENLRVSNPGLQFSEEDIARLKSELHAQIESVQRDVKMKEADLEMERRQVIELRNYTTELETHVSRSNFEIERLTKELEASKEKPKKSDEEIERLKNELANEISEGTRHLQGQLKMAQEDVVMLKARLDSERSQVLKLQEIIAKYESDLSDNDDEIRELKLALSDAQENFSLEKAQLQSDMVRLLEKQTISDARLKELELQGKALEDKIKQCETEKMERKGLYEAQESRMQNEINQLKGEAAERGSSFEALNKNFDTLKFKYDMLMAERDGIRAKVNTLMAEVSSRDDCVRQTEECLKMVRVESAQSIAGVRAAEKLVDDLRVRVQELEEEVDRQRIVILDGAEEKREAIRQLCFSLEHYRSGYKELRQAVLGHKRHAVMAA